MQTLAAKAEQERRQAIAFIAQLIRLQRQVSQMNRQLDEIEHDMRRAINELGRQRFEEYR
jgi:hypothetical protein